jgi:glycine cleavage system H protein
MTYPAGYRYTKTHEWIAAEGGKGKVGLTDYAQDHLGDITFVDLPEVGRQLEQGEVFSVVESVKAASDCYAPAGGRVVAVNQKLEGEPDLINRDPHGEGWIFELELADPAELDALMDVETYSRFAAEEGEKG